MTAFNLQRFLQETGISLHRLATYLQVAESYLAGAAAGTGRLTRRDETACRYLRRRLTRWKQLDLPFAESLETFSRDHARSRARTRAKAASTSPPRRPRGRPSSPETSPQGFLLPPSAPE